MQLEPFCPFLLLPSEGACVDRKEAITSHQHRAVLHTAGPQTKDVEQDEFGKDK